MATMKAVAVDDSEVMLYMIESLTTKIHDRERETLLILAKAAEFKNVGIELHTERVGEYSRILAKELGLNKDKQEIIYYGAQLHDIGKMGIPDSILLKEGIYTKEEYEIMKEHTKIGYEILKNAKSEYLIAGKDIALYHHECFDGSGYPYGKRNYAIPLEARIVAVADVFDALTTKRTYKEAWSYEKSMEYIIDQKGKQFDPDIADALVNCDKEIRIIYEKNR